MEMEEIEGVDEGGESTPSAGNYESFDEAQVVATTIARESPSYRGVRPGRGGRFSKDGRVPPGVLPRDERGTRVYRGPPVLGSRYRGFPPERGKPPRGVPGPRVKPPGVKRVNRGGFFPPGYPRG